MNRLKLLTLLEAVAITVCLFYVAGQQAKTGTLTSQTTIKAFQGIFNDGLMLVVRANPTNPSGKLL